MPEITDRPRAESFDDIVLIIPAYNPDRALLDISQDLADRGFGQIIVINDGSGEEYSEVFEGLTKNNRVTLLRHKTNLGKGGALKSAFQYVIKELSGRIVNVITVDADGQHRVEDVLSIARKSRIFPEQLILGVRDFSGKVPLRSRFGNLLTQHAMRLVKRIDLDDTQTGLRSIPYGFLDSAVNITCNRYEFELECIFLAKQMGLEIVQVPIETIYANDNRLSHFRPIVDSMRIYFVFLRFVLISLSSFVLDLAAFTLIYWLSSSIVVSTYSARLLSGSFNFALNKYLAFHSRQRSRLIRESVSYILLAIMIATASALAVSAFSQSKEVNSVAATKVIVDLFLFVASFLVQRLIIFRFL
jgi:glycosyltransferase involved in cell wall biosynthesis